MMDGDYNRKSKKDIRKLASGYAAGNIFTSDDVRRPEDIGIVFLPVSLGGKEISDWLIKNDITILFGDVTDSRAVLPRGVNGMPMFHSMGCLNRTDAWRFRRQCIHYTFANLARQEGWINTLFKCGLHALKDMIGCYINQLKAGRGAAR